MRALDEGTQDARLAHPGDPVQADHLSLAAQELFQSPKLRFATDERNAAPLGDRRGDDRSIIARRPRCKAGFRRTTSSDRLPAATFLVASVLREGPAPVQAAGSQGRSLVAGWERPAPTTDARCGDEEQDPASAPSARPLP
jgi:hypothetical protein